MGSPHPSRTAARVFLTVLFVFAGFLANAGQAAAQTTPEPPTFTALAPTAGGVVLLDPFQKLTFKWHIDWPTAPASGDVTIRWQFSHDPTFVRVDSAETRECPAQDVNCWSSYTPTRIYQGDWGKVWYWRVKVDFNFGVSPTWSFTAKLKPDRKKPRVKALRGNGTRGSDAIFRARMSDNRQYVRAYATVSYKGRLKLHGKLPWTITYWGAPVSFWTNRPIPRSWRAGTYTFCVKVWDKSGHTARSCTPYRIN
jgi:hypothetical protein